MTSTDELFSLYLSGSDNPVLFEGKCTGELNKDAAKKLLENDAAVEEMVQCSESVIMKKLALNPFSEEELRCELLEKIANSENSEEIFSELCQESYFTNNLITHGKSIIRQTGSLLDWKILKQESVQRLLKKFIENYIEGTTDSEIIERLKNKIQP